MIHSYPRESTYAPEPRPATFDNLPSPRNGIRQFERVRQIFTASGQTYAVCDVFHAREHDFAGDAQPALAGSYVRPFNLDHEV